MSFAYYDPGANIAWFPTGDSEDVVSERVPGGLRDYDRATRQLVAIEVWDASTRLPANLSLSFAAGRRDRARRDQPHPAQSRPRVRHQPLRADRPLRTPPLRRTSPSNHRQIALRTRSSEPERPRDAQYSDIEWGRARPLAPTPLWGPHIGSGASAVRRYLLRRSCCSAPNLAGSPRTPPSSSPNPNSRSGHPSRANQPARPPLAAQSVTVKSTLRWTNQRLAAMARA
jgi:hypothetical protein